MTMRNPLGKEYEMMKPAFDPLKSYRYTWPGQQMRTVSGKELQEICSGCDLSLLDIQEAEPTKGILVPSTSMKDNG